MKILLTGGSGMLGKNILDHNLAKNYQIFSPNSNELNLLDKHKIYDYLKHNKIELVIHCAGYVGGIHANIADPFGFLNKNLIIGLNIINAAKDYELPKLINMGSSCMYPKDYFNPLKEEYILKAPLEPTNEGYALAKILIAKMCEYITRQYGLLYKTLIPCNLYGKWDKFSELNSHLIPAIIKKIYLAKKNKQETVMIWGDGESRREFMLAEDCADAIFFAINNFNNIDEYTNIGMGIDYSINDYYQQIAQIMDYQGEFNHDITKPAGMRQKLTDITKLTNLGWSAKNNLEQGLLKTYKFFLENKDICLQ